MNERLKSRSWDPVFRTNERLKTKSWDPVFRMNERQD